MVPSIPSNISKPYATRALDTYIDDYIDNYYASRKCANVLLTCRAAYGRVGVEEERSKRIKQVRLPSQIL